MMKSVFVFVPTRARCWLVLGLLTLITGCTEEVAPVEDARPVKIAVVDILASIQLSYPGTVEASDKVELAFRVAGRIAELPVRAGDRVEQGAVVARLDVRDFQNRVNAAESDLQQAQAQLAEMQAGARPEDRLKLDSQVAEAKALYEQAAAELNRSRQLLRTGAEDRSSYDRNVAIHEARRQSYFQAVKDREIGLTGARSEEVDAQLARIASLESQRQAALDAFDDATLRAPYTGVIAQRYVELEQEIQAKEPVVKFQDIDEIVIAIDVSERETANVRITDFVSISVEFAAIPDQRFPIDRVKETTSEADPDTQTYRVRLAMRPPENYRVLPGMTATVHGELILDRIMKPGYAVPPSAIQTANDGTRFVWLVDPETMTVSRRDVEVSFPSGNDVRVVGGISGTDQIVIAGGRTLLDGMKVRDFEGIGS